MRRLERFRLQHSGISLGRLDIDERVAPGRGRESVPLFTARLPSSSLRPGDARAQPVFLVPVFKVYLKRVGSLR